MKIKIQCRDFMESVEGSKWRTWSQLNTFGEALEEVVRLNCESDPDIMQFRIDPKTITLVESLLNQCE